MEKTLTLIVTHRGLYPETAASLAELAGTTYVEAKGLANLAKARSMAFDQALGVLRARPELDVVLSADDDMVFHRLDVQRLIDLARSTDHPQSAVALRIDHSAAIVAARPRKSPITPTRPRWHTGLACMAIPRAALERVAEKLPKLAGIRVWCQTGEHPHFPGEWVGEDFWFAEHFGGVELAPIAVGHAKPLELVPWLSELEREEHRAAGRERLVIWPDETSMREVRLATSASAHLRN